MKLTTKMELGEFAFSKKELTYQCHCTSFTPIHAIKSQREIVSIQYRFKIKICMKILVTDLRATKLGTMRDKFENGIVSCVNRITIFDSAR